MSVAKLDDMVAEGPGFGREREETDHFRSWADGADAVGAVDEAEDADVRPSVLIAYVSCW